MSILYSIVFPAIQTRTTARFSQYTRLLLISGTSRRW